VEALVFYWLLYDGCMEYIKMFLTAFGVFLAIDAVWLTTIAKGFYAKHLGYIMTDNPNLVAALIFYVINMIGVVVFVLVPGLRENSVAKVALWGGLYGLATYSTYDLTNLATIKNWPLIVTVVDITWGIVLTTAVSVISFLILKRFGM
jgi:uncharacterized membrane protein